MRRTVAVIEHDRRKLRRVVIEARALGDLLVLLAGKQGVFVAVSGNPKKDSELWRKPLNRSNLRLRIFSFAFVHLRPFSGFPGAMTLELSLAVNDSRVLLVEDLRVLMGSENTLPRDFPATVGREGVHRGRNRDQRLQPLATFWTP